MVEYITPERIANSILQDTSYVGSYFLVEGTNDNLLFGKFINKEFCTIKIAHGFSNITEAISILRYRGYTTVIGVIDSDFRNMDNNDQYSDGIFYTDYHDIEMMAFYSEAMDTILSQYCQSVKVEKFKKEKAEEDIKVVLLNMALPLAYIKWINFENNYGLAFKPKNNSSPKLSYADFYPLATFEYVSDDKLVEAIINYSRNRGDVTVTKAELISKMEVKKEIIADPLQICNGHDIFQLVSIALRRKLSNLNASECLAENLERETILCYDSRFFQETRLYQLIKA